MLMTIGFFTIGVLFVGAGLVIYEVVMLLKNASAANAVVDAWLEEVEKNNNKADALLR
jgi:hypothetical protein